MLWFHLDQWYVLAGETFITHPLRIHLLSEQLVGVVCEASAGPVEPEVTARLAQYGLVIVMDLLVAHPTRVDGRGIRVGGVENHGLVRGVHLAIAVRPHRGHGARRGWSVFVHHAVLRGMLWKMLQRWLLLQW